MRDEDVCLLPISKVAPLIQRRELAVAELVELTLGRIERIDPRLNTFITVSADEARRDARRLDELIRQGTYLGPLHGIPVALKDNILTSGVRTTAGSPILREWVPDSDATAWSRLHSATDFGR